MDNMSNKEMFPVVNENGETIGKVSRDEAHGGSFTLHPVVHLHLFNSHGELYLQKRPVWKDVQPGKWDTATGGHVDYGEDTMHALAREVREELGITDFRPELIGKYVFESTVERELVYAFKTVYDGVVSPDSKELDGGRFWTMEEISRSMGKNIFTPNFEHEFKLFSLCKQQ